VNLNPRTVGIRTHALLKAVTGPQTKKEKREKKKGKTKNAAARRWASIRTGGG
jgi:hypothetical protein